MTLTMIMYSTTLGAFFIMHIIIHHTCIHAFDKRYWRMRAGEGEVGAEEGRLSIKGLFHVAGKGAM